MRIKQNALELNLVDAHGVSIDCDEMEECV